MPTEPHHENSAEGWRFRALETGQEQVLAKLGTLGDQMVEVRLSLARLEERESGQRWWNRAVIGAVLTALGGLALELAKP